MASASAPSLQHASLASSAADWITARILEGRIIPGERITEEGLAEQMGISRSPVREALRALSREGFIIVEPRRGARVGALDRTHAADLYATRLLLEPEANALSVAAMEPGRAERLEQIFAAMVAAEREHDAVEYVPALKEYSAALLAGCPNRVLADLATTAWRSGLRYWDLIVRGTPDYLSRSLAVNAELHDAVLARDPERARRVTVLVLDAGRQQLLDALDRVGREA